MVVGIKSWLLQRITAVILLIYTLIISSFFIMHPEINYNTWHNFFDMPSVKIASLSTLIALLIHAWLGLWIVTTDYLHNACIRILVQITIITFLLTCLFCGTTTIYGV